MSLLVTLKAPLMSFGGAVVDMEHETTLRYPSRAMMTGLIGNALGYRYVDGELLQQLQDNLIMSTWIKSSGDRLIDLQNAHINKSDKQWTSDRGVASRDGGAYAGPSQRKRSYLQDAELIIALRFVDEYLDLEYIRDALKYPARPLFIGRKTCLPSARMFTEIRDSDNTLRALLDHAVAGNYLNIMRLVFPASEYIDDVIIDREFVFADARAWLPNVYTGGSLWREGSYCPVGI